MSVREPLGPQSFSEALSCGLQEKEEEVTKGYSLDGFVLVSRLGHNHFLPSMSLIVLLIVE